ncbi:MAG TPA: DUF3592 domain-containing protein [Pirellulaceae bacterium]|jgi:hypothetical protein
MPPDAPAADPGFNWFSLLGLVFIAVGFGLAWFARRTWKLASASQTWPKTTAKVLKSYVLESEHTDQQNNSVTMYHAQVAYEYEVDGLRYEGKRIQFGGPTASGNIGKAQAITARYPVAAAVDVFYDPVNPSMCTLDRTFSYVGVGLMMGLGIFFIIVGAIMFVLMQMSS